MVTPYPDALARLVALLSEEHNREVREALASALESRVFMSARDGAESPSVGLGQWVGGQISICTELLRSIEPAPPQDEGKANPEAEGGFPFGPVP